MDGGKTDRSSDDNGFIILYRFSMAMLTYKAIKTEDPHDIEKMDLDAGLSVIVQSLFVIRVLSVLGIL